MVVCMIRIVQIQPRKHVQDHADYTAPTRIHELDHADQEQICHEVGLDDLSEMCNISYRYRYDGKKERFNLIIV